jgi:hypothetical protein
MEQSRANKISEVLKNVSTLGKNLKLPGAGQAPSAPEAKNAIGVPVEGSGFIRILMYVIAGILLIGLILLGVDQWITPVFKRSPGSPGYISIPGTDLSQVFWLDTNNVSDITVGSVPVAQPGQKQPLSVTVLEAQTSYSLTMDVFIADEYPQKLPSGETARIFFLMGTSIHNPTLQISLDNTKNTVYITSFDSAGLQQSVSIDNVPIYSPFRIGVTISPYIMESYLNGMLINTRKLTSIPKPPSSGNKIFATANIKTSGDIPIMISKGIKVLNIRAFGYTVSSSEMEGRMDDLIRTSAFNPSSIVRSKL